MRTSEIQLNNDRACKPGSVLVSEETSSRHLSSLGISPKFKPNGSATMKKGEQPRSQKATNQGVASDRVYSGLVLPRERVSSYLAFPSLPWLLCRGQNNPTYLVANFNLAVGNYGWRYKIHAFCTLHNNQGGLFLLHFPGSRLRRTLSVILLCDARTFLAVTAFANIRRDSPTRSV